MIISFITSISCIIIISSSSSSSSIPNIINVSIISVVIVIPGRARGRRSAPLRGAGGGGPRGMYICMYIYIYI